MEKCRRAGRVTDDYITHSIPFACRITKATDTHSEYVIVTDFPRQQRLREGASMLHLYVQYISCLNIPTGRVC